MTNTRCAPRTTGRRRSGFTITEMLVVIAILGVLASLSAAAYFRWLDSTKQTTTETTMQQVYPILEDQIKAVLKAAETEAIPNSVFAMAGNHPVRARIIWKKLRLKQEFPVTYTEATAPYLAAAAIYNLPAADLPAKSVYVRALPAAAASTVDSSALLLLALQQKRGGLRLEPDSMTSVSVADINGYGVKEILDAWGNPLAFYRWPTGNAELQGKNPAPAGAKAARYADPLDPEGLLLSQGWYNDALGNPTQMRLQFESLCHPISPDNGNTAYFIIPALASAGIDGNFGLDATLNITDPVAAADNLYSWRLRLGNKGNLQ
jgi:prepilin-type N-terminal cleavage/methylation domain-containing protein